MQIHVIFRHLLSLHFAMLLTEILLLPTETYSYKRAPLLLDVELLRRVCGASVRPEVQAEGNGVYRQRQGRDMLHQLAVSSTEGVGKRGS